MRLGILGVSPGNGHPFSFSAIVNGYDPERFSKAGWPVIQTYLSARNESDFGFPGVAVSHAWTQDPSITAKLCHACRIAHAVERPEDMIGNVDGVLLARDDAESHWTLASPFIEAGIPIFIDKPLTLRQNELEAFWPYLCEGRVMSCSGLRFAVELDILSSELSTIGRLRLVRGSTLNDWAKYGVHLLDAALRTTQLVPTAIRRLPVSHDSLFIETTDGIPIHIDALGAVSRLFHLEVIGEHGRTSVDLLDNFSAFKKTIAVFLDMVRSRRPVLPAVDTWRSISTIIAGQEATPGGPATAVPDVPKETS